MRDKSLLVISNNFPNHDDSYIRGIFVKEQVRYLKDYFKTVSVISPVAYGMDMVRSTTSADYVYDGIQVFVPRYLNVPSFYTRARSLWVSLETRAILSVIGKANIPFDLIHAHMTWPSGAVAAELKKRFDVPLVITEHTSATFANAAQRRDRCWRETFETADAIVRVRDGDNPLFEELGVPLGKVHAIPNGFDPEKFHPMDAGRCREQLDLPADRKIVLTVGNLDPVKGQRVFIEAMSQVVDSCEDVLGIIVGAGELEAELQGCIRELGMGEHVRLTGSRPHTHIPLWMNACDIFVLPSFNEGNPTVMFEALGCGKPFIGTRVGGVPAIIRSEDHGLLVEPGDPAALAEQIRLALTRSWDRNAILQYAARFSWKTIGREIADVYAKVLPAVG